MTDNPTLKHLVQNSYHNLRIGVIGTATAAAVALTLGYGIPKYNDIAKENALDRGITAYYIVTDKSMDKINKQNENFRSYLTNLGSIKEGLQEIRKDDRLKWEDRIKELKKGGKKAEAAKAKQQRDQFIQLDSRLRETYQTCETKIEEMVKEAEDLNKYSTFWRRAVKAETFVLYEYISWARDYAEKVRSDGTLWGELITGLRKFGRFCLEDVLRKNPHDPEKKFQELRGRISMYTQAELGKQGLANIMQYLNEKLKETNLAEGEKQVYLLVRDSVQETGGVVRAVQFLDYIQHGTLPAEFKGDTKNLLAHQREGLKACSEAYSLFMERKNMIVEAEEIAMKLEESDFSKLDELTNYVKALEKKMQEGDVNLEEVSISPRDSEYLSMKENFLDYYKKSLGGLCILELLLGFSFMRSSFKEKKYLALKRENQALKNAQLKKNDAEPAEEE